MLWLAAAPPGAEGGQGWGCAAALGGFGAPEAMGPGRPSGDSVTRGGPLPPALLWLVCGPRCWCGCVCGPSLLSVCISTRPILLLLLWCCAAGRGGMLSHQY